MKRNIWLSDEQFSLIEPHLFYRATDKQRNDDRRARGQFSVCQLKSADLAARAFG
jgi:hypothetical protein